MRAALVPRRGETWWAFVARALEERGLFLFAASDGSFIIPPPPKAH